MTPALFITHDALGLDTKYFPYIVVSSHGSVLLSQRPLPEMREINGGDEVSKEQSLPPNPLRQVHIPEIFFSEPLIIEIKILPI